MELLGLLDTLESMILEGFKIPMTKKTLIDEEKVLQVLDKMRLVVQGGGGVARDNITNRPQHTTRQESLDRIGAEKDVARITEGISSSSGSKEKATEIIENAYKIAKEVRMGADKYADDVLTNLEATSSRILRAVKAGRSRLGKFITGAPLHEDRPKD